MEVPLFVYLHNISIHINVLSMYTLELEGNLHIKKCYDF